MAEEIQLINKSDITEFFKLAKNASDEKVNISIMTAQQNDLEPILGDSFYYWMMDNIDTPDVQALIQGKEYEYESRPIFFRGLRALLSCYAFARFIRENEYDHTRSGMKVKNTPESENADMPSTNQRERDAFSRAKRYEHDVYKFIDNHPDEYPLWRDSIDTEKPKASLRLTRI